MAHALEGTSQQGLAEQSSPDAASSPTFPGAWSNAEPSQAPSAYRVRPGGTCAVETPLRPQYEQPMETSHGANLIAQPTMYSASYTEGSNAGSQQGPICSDWASSRSSSIAWTPSQQIENPFDYGAPAMTQGSELLSQGFYQGMPAYPEAGPSESGFVTAPSPAQVSQVSQQHASPTKPHSLACPVPTSDQLAPFPQDAWSPNSCPSADGGRSSTNAPLVESVRTPAEQKDAPVDLAARRKRPRPATLGHAALRAHSTSSVPSGPPSAKASPAGRVRPTAGGFSHARGRVQKSTSGAALRSPLGFSTSTDVNAFPGVQTNEPAQSMSTASSSAESTGNMAPPTPITPIEMDRLRLGVLPNIVEDGQGQSMYSGSLGFGVSLPLELPSNLASPPCTPDDLSLLAYQQSRNVLEFTPSSLGNSFSMDALSLDAPVYSPRVVSFPEQIYTPQPLYASQFVYNEASMASSFMPNGSMPLAQDAPGDGAKSEPANSPGLEFFHHNPSSQAQAPQQVRASQKPKNYIFANHTPADFGMA